MAQTVVLRTPAQMKVIIEQFLETVCGFTAEAAKEITKTQGFKTWTSSTYSMTRGLTPSTPL
jgi:hypothetical protein